MEIEIICPKVKKPVHGKIIDTGAMEKEEWKSKDYGLSGKESKSWKTIIVECSYCNDNHEYALTMNS